MHKLIRILLAFVLLAASANVLAMTVQQKNICQNTSVPTGWVVVNKIYNRYSCGNPATPQGNVWVIDEFDDLPVGTPLTICASSPIPSGWVPYSFDSNPALCGAQYGSKGGLYNTEKIAYVNCTNESNSLCYPELSQFGVISALPKSVPIPYGQSNGSSEIAWFAPIPVCVWVSTQGAGTALWTCSGNYAIKTWPSVSPGVSQTFKLSPSSTSADPVLASVVVRGVEGSPPKISASPTVVTIPAGQSNGSTKISYNLDGSDYLAMCIWVSNDGAPAQLWACGAGTTFSQVWPYVPKGGTSTFWLNTSTTSSSQILATVMVTGK